MCHTRGPGGGPPDLKSITAFIILQLTPMFVCICRAVPQDVVREVIAGGAQTREAVTRACRAGGDCGACHAMIEDMIEEHLECGGCPRSAPGLAPAYAGEHVPSAPGSEERLVSADRLVRTDRGDRAA